MKTTIEQIKQLLQKDEKYFLETYNDYPEQAKEELAEGQTHYTIDGKIWSGETHKDANGNLMTGKEHTEDSKFLYHAI